MKHYTIVYLAHVAQATRVFTTPARDAKHAYHLLEQNPDWLPIDTVYATIEHVVPKLTVVLDGDMSELAYADSEVELLHVYASRDAMNSALENDLPVMPDSRRTMNYPNKLDTSFAFGKVDVLYHPKAAAFDHGFVNDQDAIDEYVAAVREEWEN